MLRCISEMAPEMLNHRLILDEAPKRGVIPTLSFASIQKQNEELKTAKSQLQDEVIKLKSIQKELTDFILQHFSQKSIVRGIESQDILQILS